ncbi:MAG: hypothetical protein ABRQ25_09865 [Clostridiaceae bacterium]
MWINLNLLRIIKDHKEIDYLTLEKVYEKNKQPGADLFYLMDSHLKDLEKEGIVKREGNLIKYLGELL